MTMTKNAWRTEVVMNSMEEYERSECFGAHGCKIVGFGRVSAIGWFQPTDIQKSRVPNFPTFIRPIDGFRNHVIWGGSYAHESYGFQGSSLESLVEDLFGRLEERLVLGSLDVNRPLILEADKFSFRLASDFLDWAGFVQEFFVVAPKSRALFMRNEELEYALYCRDRSSIPAPFSGVSDAEIASAFSHDRADFASSAIDGTRIPHLKNEVLPYCDEELT